MLEEYKISLCEQTVNNFWHYVAACKAHRSPVLGVYFWDTFALLWENLLLQFIVL